MELEASVNWVGGLSFCLFANEVDDMSDLGEQAPEKRKDAINTEIKVPFQALLMRVRPFMNHY